MSRLLKQMTTAVAPQTNLAEIVEKVRRDLGYVVIGSNDISLPGGELEEWIQYFWHSKLKGRITINAQEEREILGRALKLASHGDYGSYLSPEDPSKFPVPELYREDLKALFERGMRTYVAEVRSHKPDKIITGPVNEAFKAINNLASRISEEKILRTQFDTTYDPVN